MLRATAVIDGPGGPYYSTDYYLGTTVGEAVQAAAATRDFWFQLQNFLSNLMTLRAATVVQLVDEATGNVLDEFPGVYASMAFGSAGEPLPWASQGLISTRSSTYLAGRRVRGRKFVPGCLETMSSAGIPTAATITAIGDAYDHATAIAAGAGGRCIYSLTHGDGVAQTGRTVRPYWAVLRSRRAVS